LRGQNSRASPSITYNGSQPNFILIGGHHRKRRWRTNRCAADPVLRKHEVFMRVVLAAAAGVVVGVGSGAMVVSLKGPVFHWETAGMVMVIVCGVLGGISAAVSAGTLTKFPLTLGGLAGLCIGAGLGLAVGLWLSINSNASHPNSPAGLRFWIVAMLVIAGGLSGFIGGMLARPSRTE
jgi:hypothetical protein